MNATYRYEPAVGVYVMVQGHGEGQTFLMPEHMTIAAIQNHLRELEEWLS